MKRIGAMICVMMMAITMLAPACLAVNEDNAATSKGRLVLEKTSPEDGSEGVAVDNLSLKVYFSKDVQPASDKIRKENAKMFVLKNEEGKKVPVKVYYSDDEEGLMLVAADVIGNKKKDVKIESDEKYTLTIKAGMRATDGTTLGKDEIVTLKTLNQAGSTTVYIILMVLMMGGMIFFTMKSAKKAEEKEKEERQFKDGVNPYKLAKKKGKSVEEIVAQENKKRQKKEEALAKKREAEEALEAEIIEKIRRESNKRVSKPKPISAGGSKYKVKVITSSGKQVETPKESIAKTGKGTTNPKGRSGKSKNVKKRGRR